MTLARLTWLSDETDGPDTLDVELPDVQIRQMQELIGTARWAQSEAVLWIPCRTRPDAPMEKRLFRLARITAVASAGD